MLRRSVRADGAAPLARLDRRGASDRPIPAPVLPMTPESAAEPRPRVPYQSRFLRWDARASVRVKPRRVLSTDEPVDCYFPPELHPVVSHPLVTARGQSAVDRLLVHRLYDYLRFTTELEEFAVIPTVIELSAGRSGLELSAGMRRDAFKIVTDEAWHAQFSDDLLDQIRAATSVRPVLPPTPRFLCDLETIRDRLDPRVRGAHGLLFSVVSETLISAILVGLPRDRRLPQAVRDVVADHAEDEGRHHGYFRDLLEVFWSALAAGERDLVGPVVPDLIHAFLQPDYPAVARALHDIGLSAAEIEQTIAESYPERATTASVAAAAQSCVRYFTELGALANPQTREAFEKAGLIP